MEKITVQYKSPADLKVHPLLKLVPDWEKNDPRRLNLRKDIHARGILDPLIIDPDDHILSGRKRHSAAKDLQLEEVPCTIYRGTDPAGLIISQLHQRGHYTPSALAFMTYPLFADAHKACLQRNLDRLKNGGKATISAASGNGQETVQDLALRMGVSRDQFDRAAKLHDIFAKDTARRTITNKETGEIFTNVTYEEYWKPLILSGDATLGDATAGIAGSKATNSKAKQTSGQLELFEEAFETMQKRFTYWTKMTDEQREEAVPIIRDTITAMPADLRKIYLKELKALERQNHEQ